MDDASPQAAIVACVQRLVRNEGAEKALWAIELALEIAANGCESQIGGLTPQQSKMIHALKAAYPRAISHDQLAVILAKDHANPPEQKISHVARCQIKRRRPDLWRHIRLQWGVGYRWDPEP